MCYSFEKFKRVTVTVCLQARLLWFNFFSRTRGQKLLQWNPEPSGWTQIGLRNRKWHQIMLNWPGIVWLGVSVEILIACEHALLFGRVKRVSWERASERRSRKGPANGDLPSISHKFSFPPRKPATPQSVKTVTANVLQIRKVTTACQVS